jgi:hypothetical protein
MPDIANKNIWNTEISNKVLLKGRHVGSDGIRNREIKMQLKG